MFFRLLSLHGIELQYCHNKASNLGTASPCIVNFAPGPGQLSLLVNFEFVSCTPVAAQSYSVPSVRAADHGTPSARQHAPSLDQIMQRVSSQLSCLVVLSILVQLKGSLSSGLCRTLSLINVAPPIQLDR